MNNRLILLALLFTQLCFNAQAAPDGNHKADTTVLKIKNVSIITNTINNFSLWIDFKLDLDSQMIIDDDYMHDRNTVKPKFYLTYQDAKTGDTCLKVQTYTASTRFGVIVSHFTPSEVKHFLAKDNQIGLLCKQDIVIRYYNETLKDPNDNDFRYGRVSASDINELIKNDLNITDSNRNSYVTAINNFYYFENKLDFGVNPGTDGAKTSFMLSASIRNKWAPSSLLSCKGASNANRPEAFWSLSTRLSTNPSDSLNYIDFSPINVAWTSKDFARQLNLRLASESDQTFTNKRVVFDAAYKTIIPNLVYLTTPQDNRLRLKPIVNFGAKGYYDYSNNMKAFASGQGYAKAYYYIPVYNNYSLIVNGIAFYDLSNQRNPSHKVSTNYSVTVASELPSTGFKAIIKYENGRSDIDYKTGQTVVLGLLMDFLKEKKITTPAE